MASMYSHSMLETYRVCPKKFHFAYIEKPPIEEKVAADTYLGNAVHRVLRKLYTAGSDGVLIPLEDMVTFYRAEWNKLDRQAIAVTSDYYTVDDYIRIGEEMLIRHYEKYKPFKQGTLLGAELYLTCTLQNTPFKFRCYIDRLWRKETGEIEICDYKTGQTLARPQDPKFLGQMGLYQLAVKQNYPQFSQITLAQYYLRKDEVVSYQMNDEELANLTEELRQSVHATMRATRLNDFPAQEGTHCSYCDYFGVCPAKKHRKLLDEEEKTGAPATAAQLKDLANRYVQKTLENRAIKSELDSMKAELVEIAKEGNLSVLEADMGKVSGKVSPKEKFITRTEDDRAFADLNALARQLQLDEYFVVDATSLMKDVYAKKLLPDDQLKRLAEFIVLKEESRVTVQLKYKPDDQEDIV